MQEFDLLAVQVLVDLACLVSLQLDDLEYLVFLEYHHLDDLLEHLDNPDDLDDLVSLGHTALVYPYLGCPHRSLVGSSPCLDQLDQQVSTVVHLGQLVPYQELLGRYSLVEMVSLDQLDGLDMVSQ